MRLQKKELVGAKDTDVSTGSFSRGSVFKRHVRDVRERACSQGEGQK